jgi:hypothetical protein
MGRMSVRFELLGELEVSVDGSPVPPGGAVTATAWFPRIKPEHGAHRIADGRIRIGGVVYGIAAEVTDPRGAVWTMLSAADGSRTPAQIVDVVLSAHPAETAIGVRVALDKFADAGYLDDAAASDPPRLTAREVERYSRSRLFFRWIDLRPRASRPGRARRAGGDGPGPVDRPHPAAGDRGRPGREPGRCARRTLSRRVEAAVSRAVPAARQVHRDTHAASTRTGAY